MRGLTNRPCETHGGQKVVKHQARKHLTFELALPSGTLLARQKQRVKEFYGGKQSRKSRNIEHLPSLVGRHFGPDLVKFLEASDFQSSVEYYKADYAPIASRSEPSKRFTVQVEGEPFASFTDVREALSQADSFKFYGGWTAEVIQS